MSEKHELWTGDRGLETASQFGRYSAQDELLHPEATVPGDTLTETWAYPWYIPEERILSGTHLGSSPGGRSRLGDTQDVQWGDLPTRATPRPGSPAIAKPAPVTRRLSE